MPVLTMYDYEFTETSLFNRFSTKVLVPDRIPDRALLANGLSEKKLVKYSGIKEELYVRSFEAQVGFRAHLMQRAGSQDKILAVLRPPATRASAVDSPNVRLGGSRIDPLHSGLMPRLPVAVKPRGPTTSVTEKLLDPCHLV